ncbi:aminoglycoside adenylyltransferase family protein [Streptomyces sp. AD55]|uniref:aminoglycoside adenylyltransferase family protein n=1 Tax=Streptomyces sp. AD55 TaxID=3242895 RepID=UPI00352956BB
MDQIREILRLTDSVLGRDVIGTCLHGSAVLGGLRPASDLDVLVVSRRRTDEERRRALLRGLLGISGLGGGLRPVELTVVVQHEVRPWRYPPTGDFLYGEWLRAAYEAGEVPRPGPMPDLALVLAVALAGNRALTGPPPAQVLDPVPRGDLVRASLAGLPDLLDEVDGDTRNVLLTLSRVWSTLATGRIRPKDAAADWALPRLAPEHRPVLEHARRLYLGSHYAEETWTDALRARVRPHVSHVLAEIDRAARRPAGPEDAPRP